MMNKVWTYHCAIKNLRNALAVLEKDMTILDIDTWDEIHPIKCTQLNKAIIDVRQKAEALKSCLDLSKKPALAGKFLLLIETSYQVSKDVITYRRVCMSQAKSHLDQRLDLRRYLERTFVPYIKDVLSHFRDPEVLLPPVTVTEIPNE
jgi:hypothetical protein